MLSARSAASLAGQAGGWLAALDADTALAGVAGALVSGRAVLSERAVVVAGSAEEAQTGLGALARGEHAPGLVAGSGDAPGKLGVGVPRPGDAVAGMGRELLDASPVFAERIAQCAAALQPWLDWSLVDVLRGDTDPDLMDRVDVLQPATLRRDGRSGGGVGVGGRAARRGRGSLAG